MLVPTRQDLSSVLDDWAPEATDALHEAHISCCAIATAGSDPTPPDRPLRTILSAPAGLAVLLDLAAAEPARDRARRKHLGLQIDDFLPASQRNRADVPAPGPTSAPVTR